MVERAQDSNLFTEVVNWASVRHRRAFALLGLLALLMFLPGFFTLQPMDRDEPRFAQATKQMLETHDFVSIRFQDEARNKKPVGIYWLQVAAVSSGEALGIPEARTQIWLYRLPSLAAAGMTVLLTYWAALAVTDRRRAIFAGALMAATVLLGGEAHLAKTDATLTATVVAAFGALARLYLRRVLGWRHALVFWVAIAVGILVKGPITPLIVLLAIAMLSWRERSFHWLKGIRPLVGLALCLALVAPWFILIGIKTQGQFFAQAIGDDMLNKVASGQESHGAPPLTYFALFWLTGWPLAPLALLVAPAVWAERRNPKVFFLLAWLVPAWIMFELVPTKLAHYVLPLYPALAILAARALVPETMRRADILALLSRLLAFVPPLALLLAGLAQWVNTFYPLAGKFSVSETDAFALAYLPAVLILGALALILTWVSRRRLQVADADSGISLTVISAFLVAVMTYSCVLTTSAFAPFALSQRLANVSDEARRISGCVNWASATNLYTEPSLVFLLGTELKFVNAEEAAGFLNEQTCRVAFVEQRNEAAFTAALDAHIPHVPVQRIAGINLGSGKRLDIGVYVRQ